MIFHHMKYGLEILQKKIRNRFDEETSKELLQTTWWEWSDEKIGKYSHLFDNPQEFIETIKEK